MTKIAIIGAGLSGLTIANLLHDQADITLFEKAYQVGGRMSTRRAKPYSFDHGAQYFTLRTKPFREFIQPLIDSGVIERWQANYVKFANNQIIERKDWKHDEPRYVGVPHMSSIAEHLAKNLNIKVKTRITSLRQVDKWQLYDEQGMLHGVFDWVISTIPAPQTAALLPTNFKYYHVINSLKMRACFALMLGFSRSLPLEFTAAHVTNTDVSWLAVNSQKPGRTKPFTLMVHSSEKYAEAHIDDDRDRIMQYLCGETTRIIGYDVDAAEYKTLHLWKFANNAIREHCPTFIDYDVQLAACGDWCLGGRVEGAFTAAYRLVKKMKESIL